MPCSSCQSSNQAEFLSEINMHFSRPREFHHTNRVGVSENLGLLKLWRFDIHDTERRIGETRNSETPRI